MDALTVEASLFSYRFVEALTWAAWEHQGQFRKGTTTPYISHPLAVAGLVMEHGGSEDETIAALFHDVAEDRGGKMKIDQIRIRFGTTVADIVASCSDDLPAPGQSKAPWELRKKNYLRHLATTTPSAQLVSLADKVHNLRTIVTGCRHEGETFWDRFNAKKEGTLWYYKSLVVVFDNAKVPGELAEELRRTLAALERLV